MPNPIAEASVPLPVMMTEPVLLRAVTVSSLLLLIEALRNAEPLLMALIRSPTVSLPVEV